MATKNIFDAMRGIATIQSMSVIAIVAVMVLAGCSGNGKPSTSSDSNNSTPHNVAQSGNIMNAADESWINTDINMAYVFLEHNTFKQYNRPAGTWVLYDEVAYRVNGTSVSIDNTTYQFSVSGNSLTFTVSGSPYSYTRTKPFSIDSGTSQVNEKLVLSEGQAWVMDDITLSGYIFKSDGTYVYYDGTWEPQSEGTWSTGGNTLTIIQQGISPAHYTYNISGNTLTITNYFGDAYTYTRMARP
jgi:hypothetical protein